MLSNSEIITRNYDLILRCVSYQFGKRKEYMPYKDDFAQDLFIVLLNYDNTKMNSMYEENHLNAFVTAIIQRQMYSSSSPLYKDYKRYDDLKTEWKYDGIDEDTDDEQD